MINFKPMLAPNEKVDLSTIKYPLFASTKLDGIRCIFKDGKMLSRSLKEIPNKQLQEKFQNLKEYSKNKNVILDGELYGIGLSFQQITHFVMTDDLDIKGEQLPNNLKFFIFDALNEQNITDDFFHRYAFYVSFKADNISVVLQKTVKSKEEVDDMFEEVIKDGFEGLILKSYNSKYKFGRATLKSGDMYKVKPFVTFDSEVIGVGERFENTSESYTNELGNSQKHNFKENKKSTGIAAYFIVNYNDKEQKVCITGTEEFRKEIWNNKNSYIGKIIEYKGMIIGSKDLIRHPTFIRFRIDK